MTLFSPTSTEQLNINDNLFHDEQLASVKLSLSSDNSTRESNKRENKRKCQQLKLSRSTTGDSIKKNERTSGLDKQTLQLHLQQSSAAKLLVTKSTMLSN